MYMAMHDILFGDLHLRCFTIGGILTMEWTKNGGLHRDDDRPSLIIYIINGNVTHEEWHKHGVLHRTDGPAKIYGCNKWGFQKMEWYQDGRQVLPAVEPPLIPPLNRCKFI